ncbi:MAG TPA: hypothetical protein EYH34_06975, partial [Planctomycetes bacterium]|nr:hypothetical protein [Planctomycetota bacterium]
MNQGSQQYEVEIRGVSNDRDLDLLLGPRFQDAVSSKRWDKGKVIVAFAEFQQAQEFVATNNGRMFKGGATIAARLLTQVPSHAADPASQQPRAATAQPQAVINTTPARPGQDKRRAAPYHFVPVKPELAGSAEPVLHDRWNREYWSGELHLTFKALTPLLAGNDQYDHREALTAVQDAYRTLIRNRGVPNAQVADDKKLLEPMALPAQQDGQTIGPVLISGAAQKGMLRHSLAALFSAPMERVTERTFSYRPNVTFVGRERTCRPALVVDGGGRNKEGIPHPVTVLLLSLRDLCYVQPDALSKMPARFQKLANEAAQSRCRHYTTPSARRSIAIDSSDVRTMEDANLRLTKSNILKSGSKRETLSELQDRLPVVNLNGIDLAARLNRIFHERNPDPRQLRNKSRDGYPLLLVTLPENDETEVLDTEQLQRFDESVDHLMDSKAGHLRDHPLLHDRPNHEGLVEELKRLRQRGLLPGDLIFLEQNAFGERIVPLGHHVYYRQRYRDSIHKTQVPEYQWARHQVRPCDLRNILCPCPEEMESHDGSEPEHPRGKPKRLSIARRMFGYVGTSKGQYRATEPLTFGIGTIAEASEMSKPDHTDFSQLAGRIAFNTAVEAIAEGKERDEDRFLNAGRACLVPLRPLAAPKPSAVEHYLTQDLDRLGLRVDGGILCTYGDTEDDPSAGDLRGRKFYLHQPDAARVEDGYSHCFELGVDDPEPGKWGKVWRGYPDPRDPKGKKMCYRSEERGPDWRF